MAVTRIVAEPSLTAVSVTRVPATAARHRRTRGVEHRRRLGGPSHARRPEAAGNAQGVAVVARPSDADHPGPPRPPALPPTGPPPPSRAPPGRRRQSSAPCIVHLRRGNTRLADLRVGCPLPAVLPAVSCTASRFLTRSDPQSPLVFPTNTGFLGFSVESRTGSKPGTRGTSSRSSALSTGDSTSAGANTPQDPRDRNRASPIVLVQPRRSRTARTTRSDWTCRSRTRTCRPWTPPDATVYAVELRAC